MIKKMSIWQDLCELIMRLLAIILCYVVTFLISLEYIEEILIVISKYFLYSNTNKYSILFSYNNIIEGTNSIYSIANLATSLITYPFILSQMFFFIKKGLYLYEQQKIIKNIQILIIYHFIFIFLFFYFLLPFILSNLNELNEEFDFKIIDINIELDLSNYLSTIKNIFIFNYFIGFLLLIIFILTFYKTLVIKERKIKYIFVLIISFLILYYLKRLDLVIIVSELLLNYFILYEILWFYKKIKINKNIFINNKAWKE
jgi:Sec-independent protein secretion pathway component TatC